MSTSCTPLFRLIRVKEGEAVLSVNDQKMYHCGVGMLLYVEDKLCMGTECEENKPSTSNKEDDQVSGKGTVPSTTSDTN